MIVAKRFFASDFDEFIPAIPIDANNPNARFEWFCAYMDDRSWLSAICPEEFNDEMKNEMNEWDEKSIFDKQKLFKLLSA
jgi:hypothetical protein